MIKGWIAIALASVTLFGCGDSGTGGSGGGSGGDGGAGGTPTEGGGGSGAQGGSGGGGGEGGAPPGTPCEEICQFFDDMEEKVMCGYEGGACVSDCEIAFEQVPEDCVDENIAYNDCLMMQPPESYNCTDGVFTLMGDECTDALNAAIACG